MKPLVRWTIGPVNGCGMEILEESVKQFGRIYPEFDRVVCYNQIPISDLPEFETEVVLYEQSSGDLAYPLMGYDDPLINVDAQLRKYGMAGSGWKLCPPRLRIDTHELWLDNDIVIWERIPQINEWLVSQKNIISEGRGRIFGQFSHLVPSHLKLCAGFFGLHNGFDFNFAILEHCKLLHGGALGHYDEQGLVSAIISNSSHIVVPQTELRIVQHNEILPPVRPPAIHFVGANRHSHPAWHTYKISKIKLL